MQSSARPAERDNDQQPSVAGSFGEALSRASRPADEPTLKPPGEASTATAATTTRRSGESEEDPDKPDETDLVAGLALMMLNSRTSPLVARSAGTTTNNASGVTPQDEAAATASTIARRPAGLAKDLGQPAGTNPVASLDSTAQGISTVVATLDGQIPQLAAAEPFAKVPGSASLTTQSTATLEGQILQPAAADPPTQNLGSVSSPMQGSANLYGTGTGTVASKDTGIKPAVEPALLAALANSVEKARGRSATAAKTEVNTLAKAPDMPHMADSRATTDPVTLVLPAQNNPGLPAAGTAGITSDNAGQGKIAVTQAMVSGLAAQAGSQVQPQLEALTSSQATARLAGPDVGAVADPAATSMMGSAGSVPARFEITNSTMTSSIAGNTNGIAPVLPQNVGSTDWGKALGQHVLHMSRTGQETAELQLNPPGLGPLKVSLIINENQIQAAFVSTHASVRAAVEAALPQLRAAMADGGISLGEASVGSQSQQAADTSQGQEGRPGQRSHPDSPARELAGATQRAATEPHRRVNGTSVDIYA